MYIYLYDLWLASWEQAFPFTDYGYRFTLTNFLVLAVGIQQRCINSNENCILLPFHDIKRSSTYVSRLTESRITVLAFRFVSFIIARCYSMIYFSPYSASRKMRKKRFQHRKSVLRSEYSLVSFEGGTEILSTPNERRDDTTFGHSRRIRITSLTSNLVYGPISREYRLRQILFFFLHVKLQTCALAPHFRYTFLDIRFLSFPFLLFRANVVNTA